LKKLEKKRLVNTLGANGVRGEKTYSSTLVGVLISLIFSGDEKKVVEMALKESSLLRELYKAEKDDDWAFTSADTFILSAQKDEHPLSFDEAVRDSVDRIVFDRVVDAFWNRDQESLDWLIKKLRVTWVKDVITERIKNERARIAEATKKMDAFEKELELDKSSKG
jgi:hypothetical protein